MTTSLAHPLEQLVADQWHGRAFAGTRKILAVSGGADSVALLRVLHRISPAQLEVAHFNHRWRGTESDEDQAFVESLCRELNLPCHVGLGEQSVHPDSSGGPARVARSEDSARRERYAFLESTAYRIGARCVVTAHTASDRVETMLHNLFRGTGLAGMASMSPTRPLGADLILVRPMLKGARQDVLDYLAALGQPFREDSSNSDTSYKRNFLRRQLLPLIESHYGETVSERIRQFADIAMETDELVKGLAESYLEVVRSMLEHRMEFTANAPRVSSTRLVIPASSLCPVQWPVLREALVIEWRQRGWSVGKMTSSHWNLIRRVHESEDQGDTTGGSANRSRADFAGDEIRLPLNLPDALILDRSGQWLCVESRSQEI